MSKANEKNAVTTNLPVGLVVDAVYAIGLKEPLTPGTDRSCPVGLIVGGDATGVVLAPFSWLTESFGGEEWWIPASLIERWMSAARRSDGVFEMDNLGDFQNAWNKVKGRPSS